MYHPQDSLDNFGLHRFAVVGDDEGVRAALRQGGDVNALDAAGRTALMCAVAGEHWQNMDAFDASLLTPKRLNAIRLILAHPDISLLTLNAPQSSMSGVIPLGMAAWLNVPQVIKILLEDSADSVSVDGMDSHGATALMYAARDGGLEVVQLLLSHGARPDFRDRNHRTSIQFALAHPHILWLCETVLRRHRWRESVSADRSRLYSNPERLAELASSSMPFSEDLEPPPFSIFTQEATSRLTNALISSIRSSNLAFIHSLLFSPSIPPTSPPALYPMSVPALVNLPDSNGWSLIHHCVAVEQPSIAILDALYCAGADVSLFTVHEQQNPLHILARSARIVSGGNPDPIHSLNDFTLHLIHDLCAPLSARDKNDETCIHIAAEHGTCIEMLILLLDCDTTGTVRELKNSRGLTPIEVAKTEFLYAFGKDEMRPTSALSNYTIRPTGSFASLASLSELHSWSHLETPPSFFTSDEFSVEDSIEGLLTSLRVTSPSSHHSATFAHIHILESALSDTQLYVNLVVQHFRERINEAARVIDDLTATADKVATVRRVVAAAAKGKMGQRGVVPKMKRRQRDSEDSQLTAVSVVLSQSGLEGVEVVRDDRHYRYQNQRQIDEGVSHVSTGTQTALLDLFASASSHSTSVWIDRFIDSPESTSCREHFTALWGVERELAELQAHSLTFHHTNDGKPPGTAKAMSKFKQLAKRKRKLEDKIREIDLESKGGRKDHQHHLHYTLSGMKAWLKKMVVPTPVVAPKLEIMYDLEGGGNVGCERKPRSAMEEDVESYIQAEVGDAIDASIDNALRTSQIVLEAADKDLQAISQCLEFANQFIDMANHSISRTQRVVKRAVKKREALINELQEQLSAKSQPDLSLSPGLLGFANAVNTRASLASISTIYSDASSIISVATAVMDKNTLNAKQNSHLHPKESDDDETRIVRRLLSRKIEAQTSGAWDEVEKVMGWLGIVKEAVRGVKRRAYL